MTEDNRDFTDRELATICAVRPPNKAAWDALYKRFRTLVEAKIWKMSGLPQARVEELRQDVFLRIFQDLPKFDIEHVPLEAYIFRRTASVVIDDWRRRRRESASTISLEDRPLSILEEAQRLKVPDEVVENLSRAQADGFSSPLHREIAHLILDGIRGLQIHRQINVPKHIIYGVRKELDARIRSSLEEHRTREGLGA